MIPGPDSLRIIFERCGIALDSAQLEKLWLYHRMLRRANTTLNLTRIHNFENMVLKHYVDSLLILNYIDLPSPLIDMGSGAGLPGIPLKIARPDVPMILAEPRGARAAFCAMSARFWHSKTSRFIRTSSGPIIRSLRLTARRVRRHHFARMHS